MFQKHKTDSPNLFSLFFTVKVRATSYQRKKHDWLTTKIARNNRINVKRLTKRFSLVRTGFMIFRRWTFKTTFSLWLAVILYILQVERPKKQWNPAIYTRVLQSGTTNNDGRCCVECSQHMDGIFLKIKFTAFECSVSSHSDILVYCLKRDKGFLVRF